MKKIFKSQVESEQQKLRPLATAVYDRPAEKVLLESHGAVVVAQLVERSLLTPEIRGLIPDHSKILSTNCTLEKMKIKKKRLGWPIFKN